jgi:DNA polymerase I-like protein with 3'-5' exonuclease and polymerase domains
MSLIFDLETDGLLNQLTRIHCIAILDTDQDNRGVDANRIYHGDEGIREALLLLENADEIIGHNVINFDVPAIQKVSPGWSPKGRVTDTIVLSRLIHANLMNEDAASATLPEGFQKRMWGSHSLKAWGLRMGTMKGDYDGGWETCNQNMLDYCQQDVTVTYKLYKKLLIDSDGFSDESIELEHELAHICNEIGNNGWTFDVDAANALYAELAKKRIELEKGLFEPWEVEIPFTPKRDNKTLSYKAGVTVNKVIVVEFNPNSRKHIHRCLAKKYGWKPREFTPSGDAKIDENVLNQLPYPEAKKLALFFLIQKRIAMLAEGSQGWLKVCDSDAKIRHTIVSGGTVSGRACHRSPNLGAVPSTRAAYGKQCRDLFTVPKGWVLLGSDLSGLELRVLAHFLQDGGEYAKQILEGDIHTYNQKAAGLKTRDEAKTFIYATMYGGGDGLIGSLVGGTAKDGRKLKRDFEQAIPAFKTLKSELKRAYGNRGYLKGLDGRKLFVRSEHRCLSQLLQSAGAIICKKWVALVHNEINKQNLEAEILGWIHDEVQIACRNEEVAKHVGNITGTMAEEAGRYFKIKMPIQSEYAVGRTWSDTH